MGLHLRRQGIALAEAQDVDAGPVEDRARERLATPRRREVDVAVVADLRGDERDELLAAGRDVLVVRVRLVPLEHRELRVVLVREALVAEILAELVHPLEPADDQPLEVELGGDPQIQLAVERVVVGGERAGRGAAVQRLQNRGFDLDETLARRGSAGRPRSRARA